MAGFTFRDFWSPTFSVYRQATRGGYNRLLLQWRMNMEIGRIRQFAKNSVLTLVLCAAASRLQAQSGSSLRDSSSALTIPQTQLIQPEALRDILKGTGQERPLVIQVGSHVLYAEAHIPGSEYLGPGSQPAGLQALQTRMEAVSRKRSVVLYCGCCPWNRCPNIGPAFAKLQAMGFTAVKVLYLAENFGTDWADKGYPVERGR
jgi:hypothetical protein